MYTFEYEINKYIYIKKDILIRNVLIIILAIYSKMVSLHHVSSDLI